MTGTYSRQSHCTFIKLKDPYILSSHLPLLSVRDTARQTCSYIHTVASEIIQTPSLFSTLTYLIDDFVDSILDVENDIFAQLILSNPEANMFLTFTASVLCSFGFGPFIPFSMTDPLYLNQIGVEVCVNWHLQVFSLMFCGAEALSQ